MFTLLMNPDKVGLERMEFLPDVAGKKSGTGENRPFLSKCLKSGAELEGGKYFSGTDASLNGASSLCGCPLGEKRAEREVRAPKGPRGHSGERWARADAACVGEV